MQIRQSVPETGSKMQQRTGGLFCHARIPIGCSGYDALKQAENTTHFRQAVKSRDNMNLRGAGVGEASVNPAANQRTNQTFCASHFLSDRFLETSFDIFDLSLFDLSLEDLFFEDCSATLPFIDLYR
jgi:hypothetical protein